MGLHQRRSKSCSYNQPPLKGADRINLNKFNEQPPTNRRSRKHQSHYEPAIEPAFKATSLPSLASLTGKSKTQGTKTDLPYEAELLDLIQNHDVVLIIGPTGSGKTINASRILAKHGWSLKHTVPRRIESECHAARISEINGTKLGQETGFAHGKAHAITRDTLHSIETHGYRFLKGFEGLDKESTALMIDEAHEPNALKDLLIASGKLGLWEGTVNKLILNSATPDIERWKAHFPNAGILELPATPHQLTFQDTDTDLVDGLKEDILNGLSTLAIVPGKAEIQRIIRELEDFEYPATIQAWHSRLPLAQQRAVFSPSEDPKIIVATNIAMTGHNFTDIDNVRLHGKVRRSTIKDGCPTLIIDEISKDEIMQGGGRAGRVQDGTVYNHGIDFTSAPEHIPPEIQNTSLARYALTLLDKGIFIEDLDPYFMDKPSSQSYQDAYRTLYELDLIGPKKHLTALGKSAVSFPVDENTAKMLAVAERFDSPRVLGAAIDIASIISAERVILPDREERWQELTNDERDSDMLAQMNVFRNALELPQSHYWRNGIEEVGMQLGIDKRKKLMDIFEPEAVNFDNKPLTTLERQQVIESIWHGYMNHIFIARPGGKDKGMNYKHVSIKGNRKLGMSSVLGEKQGLLVGLPLNIENLASNGEIVTTKLVLNATTIDSNWLKKNCPPQLRKCITSALKSSNIVPIKKSTYVNRSKDIGNGIRVG